MDITERARHVIAHGQQPPETLTLTPPLSADFDVYGDTGAVSRARSWALRNRYLLCNGVARCAHGLYLMDKCAGKCAEIASLDHVDLWIPSEISEESGYRAFLLYHPYSDRLKDRARSYADSHGLQAEAGIEADGWYGNGTLPVRMTIPGHSNLWPLERDALALLERTVIMWSGEEELVPRD